MTKTCKYLISKILTNSFIHQKINKITIIELTIFHINIFSRINKYKKDIKSY